MTIAPNTLHIPRVAWPLQTCCYCWYASNPGQSFPAAWSSTICDEHLQMFYPDSRVVNCSEPGLEARLPIAIAMSISELLASLAALPTLCEV